MKSKIFSVLVMTMFAAVFISWGCGAGGDASFSPDPGLADVLNDDPLDDGTGGGGQVDVDPEKERDCFLDGFCYRECETVSDCPAGFSCVMNVCTFDCKADDECGDGGRCNSVGLCEVDSGLGIPACSSDSDCGDGRYCNAEGGCELIPVLLGCQSDIDCPLGQFCSDLHSCELFPGPDVDCAIDDDCPGNYYCDAGGSCQQDCRSDYQCPEGEACDVSGRCMVPGEPVKLVSFSFGVPGAESDPDGPVIFKSENFMIDQVVIAPAGRSQVLTSPRFRLIGSTPF